MDRDLLHAYGWRGGARPDDGRLGRIVRVDRGECDLVTDDGHLRVLSDSLRSQDLVAPATGSIARACRRLIRFTQDNKDAPSASCRWGVFVFPGE